MKYKICVALLVYQILLLILAVTWTLNTYFGVAIITTILLVHPLGLALHIAVWIIGFILVGGLSKLLLASLARLGHRRPLRIIAHRDRGIRSHYVLHYRLRPATPHAIL